MTVAKIAPYNNYTGNNSTTTFDFDFLIEANSELSVEHTNSSGVQTTLTLDADYTINEINNSNGSYITFPKTGSTYGVLQSDEIISLSLKLDDKQEKNFANSSKLSLSTLEWSLDYLTRLIQIQKRQIERAIKVKEGSNATPDSLLNSINTSTASALGYKNSAEQSAANAEISANHASNYAQDALAKVQSDWTQSDNTKSSFVKNKPTLATVATTGCYKDLSDKFCAVEPFCVNSGNVDASGNADILSYSGGTLSFKVDNNETYNTITLSNCFETATLTALTDIDMSISTDGTYNIFSDLSGTTSALNNTIYRQKTEPSSPSADDIWLNTSTEPLSAKKYSGTVWEDFNKVLLGTATIASGVITGVTTEYFNFNGVGRKLIEQYINDTSWGLNWYNIFLQYNPETHKNEQWIEQSGVYMAESDGEHSVSFLKNFTAKPFIITSNFGSNSLNTPAWRASGYDLTTSCFKMYGWCQIYWYACGY